MTYPFNRRTILRAAAVGAGAASLRFSAPNLISAQGSDTVLSWWSVWPSGPQNELQSLMVKQFNDADTGVQVELSVHTDYNELANAAIIALESGEGPHIATLSESWWFAFYLRQAIHDLTPYLDTSDDYVQNLFTEYQRNGGQYVVPFARSTPILFYNTTQLDAAGLDTGIFETWTSFSEAAPDLLAGSNAKLAFGMYSVPDELIWTMQGPARAFGGRISDDEFNVLIDSPENIAAATLMQGMVANGSAATVNNPPVDFGTGSTSATILSTAYLGAMQTMALIEFGVMPLPKEVSAGVPTGGSGLGVLTTADESQLEAAAAFITYMTSTDATTRWAMTTGYMPVRTSAIESDTYQQFLAGSPDNAVAIDQLADAEMQDVALSFVPNAFEAAGGAWVDILVNNTDPATAFATAKTELEAAVEPVLEALEAIEG